MKQTFILIFVTFLCTCGRAQITCGGGTPFQILHYTEVEPGSFDHNTRAQSRDMFIAIGDDENFSVVDSDDKSSFDDLATLMNYEVIVFSNTTGNISFTATQKMNLESYVAGGGAVFGIHGATDMYRDASYPFYTRLIGGSRRNSPAHTSNNFAGVMDKVGVHPSTTNLPDPWAKNEEYYYWPDTGLVSTIVPVLEVRATGSNSYDAVRPASWYQTFDSGARSFYTTLGHARSNYETPGNDFRQHVADALCWLVEAEPASLPVKVVRAGIETVENLHRISWELGGDPVANVELHGGYTPEEAALLTSLSGRSASSGHLDHHPAGTESWFYYRLRFLDESGIPTWSEWLAAAPRSEAVGDGARVQYADGGATLVVSANGPAQAIVSDAAGRTVAILELAEGQNDLPGGKAGVYFVRFPFRPGALRFLVR